MVGPGVEEERLINSSLVSTILSSGILWTAVWRSVNLLVKGRDSSGGETSSSCLNCSLKWENELLSGTFPGFVQDSCGDIGV